MSLLSPAALLLDEVARSGSIRRAADRLNISASALNRRILNLEAEYGLALLDRLPRGVRLSAAGEVLIADIRRWRSEQDKSLIRLQELQGLRRGHVAVGLMECLAGDFASRLFERVRERHPRLTLELFVGGTDEVMARLLASRLDVAACFNVPARPETTKVIAFDVASGVIVARTHPLAGATEPIHFADCLDYPLIMPDFSLATRSLLERAMAAAAFHPVPNVVTNSIRLMKRLVRDGRHVAFLGRTDLSETEDRRDLTFVPLAGWARTIEELALCVRSTPRPTPAAEAVTDILRQLMLEPAGEPVPVAKPSE